MVLNLSALQFYSLKTFSITVNCHQSPSIAIDLSGDCNYRFAHGDCGDGRAIAAIAAIVAIEKLAGANFENSIFLVNSWLTKVNPKLNQKIEVNSKIVKLITKV